MTEEFSPSLVLGLPPASRLFLLPSFSSNREFYSIFLVILHLVEMISKIVILYNTIQLARLPAMVAEAYSEDESLQLEAATQIRDLLSIEGSPPIEEVIQAGVVPRFVKFLVREDFPGLQLEAARVLSHIADGTSENIKVLIDHGAVPMFVKLLSSPRNDVREQAVWALGNVALDSTRCRDLVLAYGALPPLLSQLYKHATPSMLRIATWTLSNFCVGSPRPAFEQMRPALPALELMINIDDEEVLTNACRALSFLYVGTNDIQCVIDAGVCPRLVELLLHPSPSVILYALQMVGAIVAADDRRAQFIINLQALPCLVQLLTSNHDDGIKKEACWTISNITAGNMEQIQAVIDAGIIGPVIQLLQSAESDIKKQAAWAIANATSHRGTPDQIKFLVNQGCIKPLCDLLDCADTSIATVCLEGLENILKVGEADKNSGSTGGVNLYARMIDEAGGLQKIANNQYHRDDEICKKAAKMLETYWVVEDWAEDCELM